MIYAGKAQMTLFVYKLMPTGTVFIAKCCFIRVNFKLARAGYVRQRHSMTKLGNTVTIWYVIAILNALCLSVVDVI